VLGFDLAFKQHQEVGPFLVPPAYPGRAGRFMTSKEVSGARFAVPDASFHRKSYVLDSFEGRSLWSDFRVRG